MIPDPKNPSPTSASIILEILSKKPGITVKELHEYYNKKAQTQISIQGLYHVVRELVKQRILVKEEQRISIEAGWIQNLQKFLRKLESTYFKQDVTRSHIILEEGESRTFKFNSPIEMDNFYSHVISTLTEYYKHVDHVDINAYAYNTHNWFQLIRPAAERTLIDAFREANMKFYHIVGSNTYLNRMTLHMFEDYADLYFLMTASFPSYPQNYYIMSIGDIYIETALPPYIHRLVDDLFQKVKSLSEFNTDELTSLVSQPGKTAFTIHRNKKQALLFRNSIIKHFNT